MSDDQGRRPVRGALACAGAGSQLALTAVVVSTISSLLGSQASAQEFSFGGLSQHTTVEEARKRYPTSTITDRHIYLSTSDAHDHISTIELPAQSRERRLKMFFERTGANGPQYPWCEDVLALLREPYGEPAATQRFYEGTSSARRMLWQRGKEVLSLACFSTDARPLRAESLTISDVP